MSLAEIREKAGVAELYCTRCSYTIGFETFLDRHADRVDADKGIIDFGCVKCGHDTIEMRRKDEYDLTDSVAIVRGLDELDRLTGQ